MNDRGGVLQICIIVVDDVLAISENAESVLRKEIGQHFVLQDESIGPPSQYLGGKLWEVTLENGESLGIWFLPICPICCAQSWGSSCVSRVEISLQSSHTTFQWVSLCSNRRLLHQTWVCLNNRTGLTRPMDVRAWLRSCLKPHYHLLAPAFICCINIHFICPFHHVPNRLPHPPSSPLAKQDHSISLTGASISIPSCLSGHAITSCPTSYLWDHTITPRVASAHLHHLHLDLPW